MDDFGIDPEDTGLGHAGGEVGGLDVNSRCPIELWKSSSARLNSKEFASIPLTSDYFPGPSHNCINYADFDSRFYEFLHSYEKPGASPGMVYSYLEKAELTRRQDQRNW